MLKRLLVVLLLLLAFAYMVFAALNYAHQPNTVVCSDVCIEIKNDALQTFVKPEDIERICVSITCFRIAASVLLRWILMPSKTCCANTGW